jgi:hypothetical protein
LAGWRGRPERARGARVAAPLGPATRRPHPAGVLL